MFAVNDVEGFEDDKEGAMRTEDVRRAMKYIPDPFDRVLITIVGNFLADAVIGVA